MPNRPEGWQSVVPRLVVHDTAEQVAFLRETFGATGEHQTDRPSVVTIGDCVVMVSGVGAREVMPTFLYVYVDDVDATYERALSAGAKSVEQPTDVPYGERRATVKDRAGNVWQIAMTQ